jgi:hypothetical protein
MISSTAICGNYSGSSRTPFRDRPKTVRLPAGMLFAFSSEWCSESPGILFGFVPESCSLCPGFHTLQAENWPAQQLYEELYCARGDRENRIKEQYSLFAGRVSAATMRANPLRLYLSAAAYVLMSAFRRSRWRAPLGRERNATPSACNCSVSVPRCALPSARSGSRSPAVIRMGACSRKSMSSCVAEAKAV